MNEFGGIGESGVTIKISLFKDFDIFASSLQYQFRCLRILPLPPSEFLALFVWFCLVKGEEEGASAPLATSWLRSCSEPLSYITR